MFDAFSFCPQFAAAGTGTNRYHGIALAAYEPVRNALSYRPRVAIVPDKGNVAVAAKASYEHRVTVPVGSILWAIAGTSEQPEGFTLNVIDAANGSALCSQAPRFANITGQGTLTYKDCYGAAHTLANPLYVFPKYRPIIEPGVLRVQILNLSANVNTVQVALYILHPPRPGEPRNHWNELLDAELMLARRALMTADQVAGTTAAAAGIDPMSQPATNQPFNVTAEGDNIVIPGSQGYRVAIHQLSLFNPTAKQTIRLLDGDQDLMGPLTDLAPGNGLFLPYQAEPHFVLTDGRPFVVNLAGSEGGPVGAVTGFAKYRMFEKWGL